MKSYQILKNEAEQKFNQPARQAGNNKKENALGVISKSLKATINLIINHVCLKADLKFFQL
ncbi:hypothetical protein SAMN04488514_106105 [Kriegella aquimaris]|uniref:Uncharacterized protein n=2 Tax=Kriegella aquimaris TaxID=192904 RepID=A0A1G9REF8_9FLAO|nr:hypothetical protein SAMN04488514_106105 [Kriegella aquimaris]